MLDFVIRNARLPTAADGHLVDTEAPRGIVRGGDGSSQTSHHPISLLGSRPLAKSPSLSSAQCVCSCCRIGLDSRLDRL